MFIVSCSFSFDRNLQQNDETIWLIGSVWPLNGTKRVELVVSLIFGRVCPTNKANLLFAPLPLIIYKLVMLHSVETMLTPNSDIFSLGQTDKLMVFEIVVI